ncbi:hypothetical protein DACRYDRAFT_108403 [Dacryopinax primogenitus]|uniref:Uncharacterized protein n=1 Tax=Dacryopinax primogenitus (strain DJM 731) TaxID=1858805 RepID=M5G5I3_DACPD|nr:uncharacterized protein DACRYDRAFT_108403 [Dacryopinax primogenitus]EJU01072.1 hypothetical protein DACRYDRAFT_108403 [Dacryopinax primogenitus]
MAVPNETVPIYVFKILLPSDFPTGVPAASSLCSIPAMPSTSLDQSEGFIHLSRARQLLLPLSRFFISEESIVLVRVVFERVEKDVRWDRTASGDEYPHLLRQLAGLDCDEVKTVRRMGREWEEVLESEKAWVWS